MRKLWKSYSMFLTAGYRWGALLLSPLLILAASLWMYIPREDEVGMYIRAILLSYVTMYEILSDYWLFGGICNREENCMEYVKSSHKGLRLIEYGVLGDLLRRFLYLLAYGIILYAMTGQIFDLLAVLLVYVSAVTALNLSRHMITWQLYMLTAGGGMMIFIFLFVTTWIITEIAGNPRGLLILELAIGMVISIVVTIVTAWYMMFCVKRSYYEKGFAKGN